MPKGKGGRPSRPGLQVVSRPGTSALYLRGTVRGRSIFESTGTDNRELAEEARATREAELYRGAIHGEKKTVTFAEAALEYLNRPTEGRPVSQNTKTLLGRVIRHFGPTITCDKIDQVEIDRAGRALCAKGSKASSILRAGVTPTKAVLTYAAHRGWCAEPSFQTTKGGGKRTDWFTPAEAEAMITAAADHLKPLLVFLFCTGARVSETLGLDWKYVDLKYRRATILGEKDANGAGGTKNGDDRIIDLPPRAMAALANLPGQRTGRVFLTQRGEAYRDYDDNKFGSGGGQIRKAWKTALDAAKIDRHLTPHHARHSWATWHYLVHKDLVKLRIDGGWRTTLMCERYTKLAPNELRADVEAFMAVAKTTESVQVIDEKRLSA